MSQYDLVIVGAGTMGLFTGYNLAKDSAKVLMIDAFNPPHNFGSHHGETRITRQAIGEGLQYVPLAKYAYQVWNELQAETHEHIFLKTGVISFGGPKSKFVGNAKRGADEYGIDYEYFENGLELTKRWPDFQVPEDYIGLLEPDAGVVFPENILRNIRDKATTLGAELVVNSPVMEIQINENDVEVRTSSMSFTADKLIVTAGAYSNKIFSQIGLEHVRLEPTRRTVGWFYSDEHYYKADVFPGFFGDTEVGIYYGFPSINGEGVKVGRYFDMGHYEPEFIIKEFGAYEHDQTDLEEFLDEYMPKANKRFNRGAVCMFTNTSDENFILDQHPEHDHVIIGAGFSGHGFKFSPTIGRILADLAQKGETDFDISSFSIEREALNHLFSETMGSDHFSYD